MGLGDRNQGKDTLFILGMCLLFFMTLYYTDIRSEEQYRKKAKQQKIESQLQEQLNKTEEIVALALKENKKVETEVQEEKKEEEQNNTDMSKLDYYTDLHIDISRSSNARELPQVDIEIHEDDTKNVDLGPLVKTKLTDEKYKGTIIKLSSEDKKFLYYLVMAEAGGEGYIGQALVAQAIRDAMVADDLKTPKQVQKVFRYTKNLKNKPTEEVKKAVDFIFDQGGIAVQHRILYFYAPALVKSKFHESELFIVEYRGHRFFDRRVDVGKG